VVPEPAVPWQPGPLAAGPADLLRSELRAAAAFVFAQALPGGADPGPDQSGSYAEWLASGPAPRVASVHAGVSIEPPSRGLT
jgi:hypothetical protein